MFNCFRIHTKVEKIVVIFVALAVTISGVQIGRAFYQEYSSITPVKGGIYIEGSVGKLETINPLYVHYGTVTHDVIQLVFSGLTRYDPKTGDIVPDLADYKVSGDGKKYTFTLREDAYWHDNAPVTSADVIFTYDTVIGHPFFDGTILNYNDFSGMKVYSVDDRTVEFILEEPDSFFLVKTIIGLLPDHILGHLPVETLSGVPFNQFPVGTGPYRFVSLSPADTYQEITLEAFDDYYGKTPNIPTIQLRIFSSEKDMIRKQGELDGIRNVPAESTEKILEKGRLNLIRYQLPQYVAVFLNTEAPFLKNKNVRLALQLGTDKNAIAGSLGQSRIIDTPLLEIDQVNWVYQHSIKKANGALFETEWKVPEPPAPTPPALSGYADLPDDLPASTPEADTGYRNESVTEPEFITSPNGGNDWQTTDTKVTLAGIVPPKTKAVIVNDYELSRFVPGDKSWSYIASFEFNNLKSGENLFEVYAVDFNGEKTLLDSIRIIQGTADEFLRKEREKLSIENEGADDLPIRVNSAGNELVLRLIAPAQPESYALIASALRDQWKKIGVGLEIRILENEAFQKALFSRDYDLLIFGQNLGYNLDAYPYWHSSQAKEGGYNLSQFKNFVVDSLLDKARLEYDEDRLNTLNDIQKIFSTEIPAIFLYSPTYYFALSDKIQNPTLENLATTSDRFAAFHDWFGRVDRRLNPGVTPLTFLKWVAEQF
jgi:ABC-type transport system substrate-binding protein